MKRPLLPAAIILILLGLILWRESRAGFLRDLDHAVAKWNYAAMGGETVVAPAVVLVLQGGIRGEELSTLDVGLFTRAAARLEVAVAGVAAWEIASAQVRLVPPAKPANASENTAPHFLGGTLLLPQPTVSGQTSASLKFASSPPAEWQLPRFAGSYSNFPEGVGWQTGFLNLPDRGPNSDPTVGYLLLAEFSGQPVPSFALAAALGSSPDTPLRISDSGSMLWGNFLVPLQPGGILIPGAGLLRKLHRVDMDDLLLEAERREKNLPGDENLRQVLAGSVAILGTLAQDEEILTAPGSARRLSLVELQGLALQSLFSALEPPCAPWWVGGLILLCLLPLLLGLWFIPPGTASLVATLLLCGSLLLGGALAVQTQILFPAMLPSVLWPAAALLRHVLRRPRISAAALGK